MKTLVIIVGKPICTLESLGFSEDTILFENEERFLPRILVKHDLFKSTSVIRRLNGDRLKNDQVQIPFWPWKAPNDRWQNLWRTVGENGELEMTGFKIGRTIFWLIVGALDENNS